MPLEKTNTINIFFPLQYRDVNISKEQILGSDYTDSHELIKLFKYMYESPYIGKVGKYDNVFELTFGIESFMPTEKSNPTSGIRNRQEVLECLQILTFISTSDFGIINDITDSIAKIHPWEHPVIKCWVSDKLYVFNPKSGYKIPD